MDAIGFGDFACLESIHLRHSKIHCHHIGDELLYFGNHIPAIDYFPADLPLGMLYENSGQQLTNATIVVRDQDLSRHKLTMLLVCF